MSAAALGILDTSTLILLERLDPDELPVEAMITAVTLGELSVGPLVATDETERAPRLAHLQLAEADFEPLPYDVAAGRAYGRVAANLHLAGRKRRARNADAMIAAIAIANGLPLFTCDAEDFEGIDGLARFAVTHPDSRS